MQIHIWRKQDDALAGMESICCIDLMKNSVNLFEDANNQSTFYLSPEAGRWHVSNLNLTRANDTQAFVFDTTGSMHTRWQWMNAVHANMMCATQELNVMNGIHAGQHFQGTFECV
jgi:hypothetical protein